MDGIGGYGAWRWIFIIEGLASIIAGVVAMLLMPDAPGSSGYFLTPAEIRYLQVRQLAVPGRRHHGQGEGGHKFDWKTLVKVLKDWQMYLLAVVYLSSTGPNYALKFTMPQIIKNMGYQSSMAQVLTIPPYTVGVIATISSAILADRITWRMPFTIVADICMIVAHAILYVYGPTQKQHIPACYFALCLACVGFYPIPPTVNAWLISNTAPQNKRAMAIGYFVGLGNIGGIFGSFIYRDSEAPRYPSGYATAFSLACAGIVSSLALEFCYKNINEKRGQMNEDDHQRIRSGEAEDDLDKDLLLSFLKPESEITLDISGHLDSVPTNQMTPLQYWAQTVELLSGFTATQHHIGNPIIDISEDNSQGQISVEVIAYHCIQEGQNTQSVTARARQTMDMERSNGKWFVKGMKIDRKIPLDNPGLYEKAQERHQTGRGRLREA
ncbi:hypothetical protein E8E14_013668 [Neopestalotiopsis sp. 37M]|nr:hypothetical protein E8E14_013668 [Neopestalotiopsis sp. 37M]